MARFHSQEPVNKAEREVCNLLKSGLTDDWHLWHEPELPATREGQSEFRPDFILLHPERGLFVLEVKGWTLDRIRKVREHQGGPGRRLEVLYEYGEGPDWVETPGDQLKKYRTRIRQQLKERLKGTGLAAKQVNSLFEGAVVFTNIDQDQVRQQDLLDSQDRFAVLLPKALRVDQGKAFHSSRLGRWRDEPWRLRNDVSASPTAKLALSDEVLNRMRAAFHPESIIFVPSAKTELGGADQQAESAIASAPVLDLDQEAVARQWIGRGHRILFGVAGSGKTVILIARAKYQAMRNPEHRILVLCYNRSLALYIEKALAGNANIEVRTFHSWAWSLGFRWSDWNAFGHDFLEHLESTNPFHGDVGRPKYDCLLIDECQDWQPEWFKAVLHAAKDPIDGDLLIVGDGSQSVYRRAQGFSWKGCGVRAQGRVVNRRGGKVNTFRNYRNTPEVVALASHFAKKYVEANEQAEDGIVSLLAAPEQCARPSRAKPMLRSFASAQAELHWVGQVIKLLKDQDGGLWPCDFGVIYFGDWDRPRLAPLFETLQSHSIEFDWIVGDQRNQHRLFANSVKVLNALQVKGLELRVCFVVGADDCRPDDAQQLYVAMTRATERLYVSHLGDSDLIRQLRSDPTLFRVPG